MWLYVDTLDEGKCWEWIGANKVEGYGRTRLHGKTVLAHRLSYCLANNVTLLDLNKSKLLVRHRCDNPPCCNPAHLHLGTHAQNMADRTERGRWGGSRGVDVNTNKVTEADVLAIRQRRRSGEIARTIADDFSIHINSVYAICSGQNWAWLEETKPNVE